LKRSMPPIFVPRSGTTRQSDRCLLGGAIGFQAAVAPAAFAGADQHAATAPRFSSCLSQFTDTSPRGPAPGVTGILSWRGDLEGVNVRGLNTAAPVVFPARSDCSPAPANGAGPSSPPGSSQVSTSCCGRGQLINRQPLETAEIEASICDRHHRAHERLNPRYWCGFWGQRSASARAQRYRRYRRVAVNATLTSEKRRGSRSNISSGAGPGRVCGRALADGEHDR
jgi:hypothetical protein